MARSLLFVLPWLLLGSGLSYFSGWEPNVLFVTWLIPLFLIRFAREAPRTWQVVLLMQGGLTLVGWVTVRGAWHMGAGTELFFAAVMAVPLVVSCLADRLLHRRLSPLAGTLVFPSVWTLFDFLYSFTYGLGDVFSPALTQFQLAPIRQLVSVTGIYGITFLMGWFASVAVTVWQSPDTLRAWKAPAIAYGAVLGAVLLYGSVRLASFDHEVPTVRIASVVVPHLRSYHEAIVDKNLPASEAHLWRPELAELEDQLFAETARAAQSGAKIVFWSEAAAVMYEDHEGDFLERAREFAMKHRIFLQTASLVVRFDDTMIENQITLFTPEGELGYTYLKTQTWYPTESDGVIHSVDTPYGRISSVICFDLDVPSWMQTVATLDAAILLVPGFDTLPISPYHTQTGLFRAVEGGYSIVRGVADGTSMAVDSRGRTLALQDSFRTEERIMYVDVPTRSHTTFYGMVGDWFPIGTGLLLGVLIWLGVRRP